MLCCVGAMVVVVVVVVMVVVMPWWSSLGAETDAIASSPSIIIMSLVTVRLSALFGILVGKVRPVVFRKTAVPLSRGVDC